MCFLAKMRPWLVSGVHFGMEPLSPQYGGPHWPTFTLDIVKIPGRGFTIHYHLSWNACHPVRLLGTVVYNLKWTLLYFMLLKGRSLFRWIFQVQRKCLSCMAKKWDWRTFQTGSSTWLSASSARLLSYRRNIKHHLQVTYSIQYRYSVYSVLRHCVTITHNQSTVWTHPPSVFSLYLNYFQNEYWRCPNIEGTRMKVCSK